MAKGYEKSAQVEEISSHPVTLFIEEMLDEQVFNLYRRACRPLPKETELRRIKGLMLVFIENRAVPLVPASQNTYRIAVDLMSDDQINELFREWL